MSLTAEELDALTKRTQDGGTEVVQAKAGKVGQQPQAVDCFNIPNVGETDGADESPISCRDLLPSPWLTPLPSSLTPACADSTVSRILERQRSSTLSGPRPVVGWGGLLTGLLLCAFRPAHH